MSYHKLATKKSLQKTVDALNQRGYQVIVVKNKDEALEQVKQIIPEGASVMNGASVTLEQIGYQNYLATGEHQWVDWHAKINAEDDQAKRAELRKQALLSDFYLGSVHALTETGEALIASNTGSQLPQIAYSSPNVVFVLSTKKIVPNLDEAMKRLEEYIIPLEDKHMMELYNMGTALHKILIFRSESQLTARKITFLMIEEDLGF